MAALIDRLPPEILSHIFVTLVQSSLYAASVGDKSYNAINYPLLLSGVSTRWRQVAISTPVLWSHLDLYSSGFSLRNIEYLNMCYERSASVPLSVRLGNYTYMYYDNTVREQLASLLISYTTRLYSLVVAYRCPGFGKKVLSTLLAQGSASQIRELALRGMDDLILADGSLPQDALNELLEPLHSLRLEWTAFDWATIRCGNLVELQLNWLDTATYLSSSQLVSFLNANPKIRKLRIGDLRLPAYESNLPPIKLPELQNLSICLGLGFTVWFFALLAPGTQVSILQLDSYVSEPHRDEGVINALCQFFQRSRIVRLRMRGSHCIPFSNVAIYLPHLETLRTEGPKSGYDLSNLNMQPELLPKLHTVELIECTTRDVESGLGVVLSLPSVKQILYPYFSSVDVADGATLLSIDQVRELMRRHGVTANLRIAPELLFCCSPTPFL